MKIKKTLSLILTMFAIQTISYSQIDKSDWEANFPDGCTSVTVGKKASIDGSVQTSHTDDSHRTRSEMYMTAATKNKAGSMQAVYRRVPCDTFPMPTYQYNKVGEIPQVENTYAFINTAYPCMNEKQLAIGESTFGGREVLQSNKGLIDCPQLCQLMLERCTTARDAIKLADKLTKIYGWSDAGECLTIADKQEVWHFEIVGPGKDKVGAVWVAQRVPDENVSVNANASTIREIDLKNTDFFMASDNIYSVAKENGWYKEGQEIFRFSYAYAPESRTSLASRRREWRVFDLMAPSLKLDPNAENYPFSLKPDKPVTLEWMQRIFSDYYEGTAFDMTKDLTVANDSGKMVISPMANPQMPYDMNKMLKINGGWGWRGERPIARWYTMYATITQSRSWLPDEVGGVVWLALDNVVTSIYVPVYCSVTDLPKPYKTPGRTKGYTYESAWWAFNRLGTLASHRWGDMRKDIDKTWKPLQKELFTNQSKIENDAVLLINQKKNKQAIENLTKYTNEWGIKVVKKAWDLGDFLWTKYDELF
ncbi:MAG: dipeptidase [Bacteroidales bacterium]